MAKSEFTNKLLREAIADAEAVRQTAIENAKLSLEETFTPAIKSMISRRLRAEAEGMEPEEDEKEVEKAEAPEAEKKHVETEAAKEVPHEEAEGESKSHEVPMDTSKIGTADNAEPSDAAEDSSDIGEGPEAHHDSETDWYDDWTEADFDLDEVIKELEEDMKKMSGEEEEELDESWAEGKEEEGEEEDGLEKTQQMAKHPPMEDSEEETETEAYPDEAPVAGTHKPDVPPHSSKIGTESKAELAADLNKFVTEPSTPKMEGEHGHEEGEEEELDLEVILRELEAEDEKKHADSEKMAALEKELDEYRTALKLVREKLHEVNLLNAKLLYTNRIFRKDGLTNEQKVTVVENFDRATSVREVKMVYTVLVETLTSAAKAVKATKPAKKVVAEGLASKATPSTAPKSASTEVIAENSVAKRLQQLAGLI